MNSRPPPWQGGALPLSHFRSLHYRGRCPRLWANNIISNIRQPVAIPALPQLPAGFLAQVQDACRVSSAQLATGPSRQLSSEPVSVDGAVLRRGLCATRPSPTGLTRIGRPFPAEPERDKMVSETVPCGGMAEWTMAAVLKTVMQATVSWVRIPLPPPHLPLYSRNSLLFPTLCGPLVSPLTPRPL